MSRRIRLQTQHRLVALAIAEPIVDDSIRSVLAEAPRRMPSTAINTELG